MIQQSQKMFKIRLTHTERDKHQPLFNQQMIEKQNQNQNNDKQILFQNCLFTFEQTEEINRFQSLELNSYDSPKLNKVKSNIKNDCGVDPWSQNFYQVIQYAQQVEKKKNDYQNKKRKFSNLTETNFNTKNYYQKNDINDINDEIQKQPQQESSNSKQSIKNIGDKFYGQKYEFNKIQTTDQQKLKWKLEMQIMMRKRRRLSHLLKARQFGHMKINSLLSTNKQFKNIGKIAQIKFKKYINQDNHKKIIQHLETQQDYQFNITQQNLEKNEQLNRKNNKKESQINYLSSTKNVQSKSPLLSSTMMKTLSKFIKQNDHTTQNSDKSITNLNFYIKNKPQSRIYTQRSVEAKFYSRNKSEMFNQKQKINSQNRKNSLNNKKYINNQGLLINPLTKKNQKTLQNISLQNEQLKKNERFKMNFIAKKKSDILVKSSYLGYSIQNKPKQIKSLPKQISYASNNKNKICIKEIKNEKIIQANKQILQVKPKQKLKINLIHYNKLV